MKTRSNSHAKFIGPVILILATVCLFPVGHADEAVLLDPFAVAILPTTALSDEASYSQLAEAIHVELVSQLTAVDGIHVIDPGLVRPYTASTLTPVEIARLLGAATVIESSVSPGAGGLSIRLRCLDAVADKLKFSLGSMSFRVGDVRDERIELWASKASESIEHGIFRDRAPDWKGQSATARATFLDTNRPAAERLKALRDLRPSGTAGYPHEYVDGGAALSGEVAAAAIQLAARSEEPHVRAAIWQTMAGVGDAILVQPLILALTHDPEHRVRGAAAEALATHRDQHGVLEALEIAADNDADASVRKAARYARLSAAELHEEFIRVVMDDSESERDRQTALFRLTLLNGGDPFPIGPDVMDGIAGFARSASDPMIRRLAWFGLVRLAGHDAISYLTDALPEERDEAVREGMVSSLSKYIDQPDIREVVRDAEANDLSPLVRNTATRVLRGDVQ